VKRGRRPDPETCAAPGPDLVAHIDGGSRGNPGPAGYGVHVATAAGDGVAEIYGFLGVTTNNVAEYAALLALLERAQALRPRTLVIRSDSELLVRQMNGQYRVKDPNLKRLHEAARRLLADVPAARLEHVRREANRAADALANRAMDEEAGSAPLPQAILALPGLARQSSLPNL